MQVTLNFRRVNPISSVTKAHRVIRRWRCARQVVQHGTDVSTVIRSVISDMYKDFLSRHGTTTTIDKREVDSLMLTHIGKALCITDVPVVNNLFAVPDFFERRAHVWSRR